MSAFPHPFADGKWRTIGELAAWEARLLQERQTNQNFSSSVRRGKGAHAAQKTHRNKELAPLHLYAMHKAIPESSLFRVPPEKYADVELIANGKTAKLQFTTAFPSWVEGEAPGYQHALKNEALDLYGGILASARFSRAKGGKDIEYEGGCVTDDERLDACRKGLELAITNKMQQDGKGVILIVYAIGYRSNTDTPEEFAAIARSSLENARFPPFDQVSFLDYEERWFVEFLPQEFS